MVPARLISVTRTSIGAGLDETQRFVRVRHFMHAEAGGVQTIGDQIADHDFIFDQQKLKSQP